MAKQVKLQEVEEKEKEELAPLLKEKNQIEAMMQTSEAAPPVLTSPKAQEQF